MIQISCNISNRVLVLLLTVNFNLINFLSDIDLLSITEIYLSLSLMRLGLVRSAMEQVYLAISYDHPVHGYNT